MRLVFSDPVVCVHVCLFVLSGLFVCVCCLWCLCVSDGTCSVALPPSSDDTCFSLQVTVALPPMGAEPPCCPVTWPHRLRPASLCLTCCAAARFLPPQSTALVPTPWIPLSWSLNTRLAGLMAQTRWESTTAETTWPQWWEASAGQEVKVWSLIKVILNILKEPQPSQCVYLW